MARLPRLYAPNLAQLIAAEFAPATDWSTRPDATTTYERLLSWLGQGAKLYGVVVQGWCISPKGLYLLALPADSRGISHLIQDLGRRLAAHLKTGAVFNGRYHSTIPEPQQWVLASLVWLESQPVREGRVKEATDWLWSSARAHTEGTDSRATWLQPHHDYWLCGNTPFARQAAYREQLALGNTLAQHQNIEQKLTGQWGLGGESFLAELATTATRRVQPESRGRPRNPPTAPAI